MKVMRGWGKVGGEEGKGGEVVEGVWGGGVGR